MNDDPEYDDLMCVEKEVTRQRKKAHYHLITSPCCDTCEYIEHGYEGERKCSLLFREKWEATDVYVAAIGVCDNYKEART